MVVNGVGMNPDEAMRILGIVGLSEVFLMLRRYKELSEGQKYRHKLAKFVDQKVDTCIVDEFRATIDDEMAKYNPFFEKAGMTLGGKQKFTRNQEKLIRFVQARNMNVGLLQDHTIRKGFLN